MQFEILPGSDFDDRETVHFSSAAKTYVTCFFRQRVLVKMSSLGLSWLPSGQMALKYRSGGWLAKPFPFGEGVVMVFEGGDFAVLCHLCPPLDIEKSQLWRWSVPERILVTNSPL